jgi:hypothetical protein
MPPRRLRPNLVCASWGSRFALALILVGCASLPARTPDAAVDVSQPSSSRPLTPEYRIHGDGSVTLRICFNWSCASRQRLDFTAQDMREVAGHMAMCPRNDQRQRLQRLRIGVWRMEALAQKYQPLLANDEAVNTSDQDREGRMDCIDNASNTTTYLHVLHELGLLTGWSPAPPQVRDAFSMSVHWTAVAIDRERDEAWSVDAWYRPNSHLPFVMPLADWEDKAIGWHAPFAQRNPYPRYSNQLCDSEPEAPRS